jgi:hypothetical protein
MCNVDLPLQRAVTPNNINFQVKHPGKQTPISVKRPGSNAGMNDPLEPERRHREISTGMHAEFYALACFVVHV